MKKKSDTYTLAKSLVALFADEVPRASARVARAPHPYRVASLTAIDQLETCIMPASIVVELASGSEEFSPCGPVSLRGLFKFDDLLFEGLKSMPEHRAQMIYQALLSKYPADQNAQLAISWHRGIADHGG